MRLLVASNNAKKLAELQRILAPLVPGVEVLGLGDVAAYDEPAETEATFEGNALIKARAALAATGLPSLADDSGLAVDVLGGAPGVFSARWAGPLAEATGAAYHVNAEDQVSFHRVPVRDGDVVSVGDRMRVRVIATPGHTFTHLSYALAVDGPDGEERVRTRAR